MSAALAADADLAYKIGEEFCQCQECAEPLERAQRFDALLEIMAEYIALLIPPPEEQVFADVPNLICLEAMLAPLLKRHAGFVAAGDEAQAQDEKLALNVQRLYEEYMPFLLFGREGLDLMPYLVLATDPVPHNCRRVLFECAPAAIAKRLDVLRGTMTPP